MRSLVLLVLLACGPLACSLGESNHGPCGCSGSETTTYSGGGGGGKTTSFDGTIDLDGTSATLGPNIGGRLDARPFHVLVSGTSVRIFTDAPCGVTCDADAGDASPGDGGDADAGDNGTDADTDAGDTDAGDTDAADAGSDADTLPDATFTPPRPGESRLLLAIDVGVTETGSYDLATPDTAVVHFCASGYLLDSAPQLYCGEASGTLRPADRAPLAGSLVIESSGSYTLDAKIEGRGSIHVSAVTTVAPYYPGSSYKTCEY
jgi:hypothetical protein